MVDILNIDNNDPYYLADIAGLPAVEFVTANDRRVIANYARFTGVGAYFEYMDRRYIDDNGQSQPFHKLIADLASDNITGDEFDRLLLGTVDAQGNQITGADWYEEFQEKALAQAKAGTGFGTGGPTTEQKIESVFASVRDRALQMGLSYTDDELIEVATVAVNSNWTDTQVVDKLLTNYSFGQITDGTISDLSDGVTETYRQFFMDIDSDTSMKIARDIALGEKTIEGVLSSVKRLAKLQYSWAEPFINDGLSLKDAIAPQRSALASELELDASEIDLNNPMMFDSLFKTDEQGAQRLASSVEVRKAARELPQWEQTQNARATMSNMTASLGRIFGRSGF